MTNHVPLLLTPRRAAAVPRLIIALGRRHVQYVNHTYRRTGTLRDSRYKPSATQAETYLLACQRYIELNPVQAAMVDDPAHTRWTSYRANALGRADARITRHPVFLALARDAAQRCAVYRALLRAQLDAAAIDDLRLALTQNQPVGNARFLARVARAMGERRQARPRGRPRIEVGAVGRHGERALPISNGDCGQGRPDSRQVRALFGARRACRWPACQISARLCQPLAMSIAATRRTCVQALQTPKQTRPLGVDYSAIVIADLDGLLS
jgi:putative transposase